MWGYGAMLIYCSAPCKTEDCFRHIARAGASVQNVPSRWHDFSPTCDKYQPDSDMAGVWRATRRTPGA